LKSCLKLLALIFLTESIAFAQQPPLAISGRITHARTGEPIPFASIYRKGKSVGTSANEIGEFVLKLVDPQPQDTLVVSSIGFKSTSIRIPRNTEFIAISLEPATVQLAEVVVNSQAGLDLIKQVMSKVPDNYDTASVQFTAFYRENLWLGDFELNLTEAVLDIYKIFKTEKKLNDQIRVIKGRKKKIDFGRDGQFYFWLSGISNGARGSLSEDLIKYRNSQYSPFNPKNFRYYNYDLAGTIREGDRTLLMVDITPKESRKAILAMKVYVDEATLTIPKYDFELSPQGVKYVSRKDKGLAYAIMTKVVKARIDYHKFRYSINYRAFNGKWYLNSVRRHWEILVNSEKRNMKDELWRADMDLIITDIQTKNVKPITEGNIGTSEATMSRFIDNNYDESFWENYNYLKPIRSDSTIILPTASAPSNLEGNPILVSNRQNGFTRADTLRGKLTTLRTCYDVTFYHLDATVDLQAKSVSGNNLIRFKVLQPLTKLQIDLYANMAIEKILYKNQPLAFDREFDAVFVRFPFELKPGSMEEIKVYYNGVPQVPNRSIPMNGGILWETDSLGNPWAQVVCQGSGASLWWPNKDHLSDEPDSMKIWITVPEAFTEISNGRLKRKTSMPNHQMRFEWEVSYPINNYNVTFNIGKYAHYRDYYVTNDTLTIDYYVMPYNLDRSKQMFKQVKPMLQAFEKYFGKYPFARDGFTLVESLYPMEHQSGVCIGRISQENSGATNPLLWHESAHEWWGNAISCADMADLWIHEAFATYAEALVVEQLAGREAASDMINDQQVEVRSEEPVIGVYDVNHIFYEIGDMYSKGSLMLHTFRSILNDDARWIQLLKDIQHEFRYKTLTSDQLIAFINRQTKTDYTYFFDQYLRYTSLPALQLQTVEKGTDLEVQYRWEAEAKNFHMPVKVTTAPGRFAFIYPTPEWKRIVIKNMNALQFEVDEDHFFIDVDFIE